MKRIMTLVSAIAGTVMSGITMFFSFIFAVAGVGVGAMDGQEYVDQVTGDIYTVQTGIAADVLIVIGVVLAIICIAGIIINALCIKQWKAPVGKYKKGLIVTAVIFNFISAILCFMMVATIFFAFIFIASAIVYIVDICREKRRVENAKVEDVKVVNEVNDGKAEAVIEVKAQPDVKPAAKPTAKVVEKDSLEDRIVRLNEMKKKGLITDEEYEVLKKDIINKELSK